MKKLGTDQRLKKKLQEILDLTTAENAAIDNANNPSASNPFATMADVENVELGADIVDALAGAGDPSSSNPFATISDIADLGLDSDELDAIESSNNPSTANPFATIADISESGGGQMLEVEAINLQWLEGDYLGSAANHATIECYDIDEDFLNSGILLAYAYNNFLSSWQPLPLIWVDTTGGVIADIMHVNFVYSLHTITMYSYNAVGVVTPDILTKYRFVLLKNFENIESSSSS